MFSRSTSASWRSATPEYSLSKGIIPDK